MRLERLSITMATKNPMFNTAPAIVNWANIADPDEFRGTVKHQIQVIADADCVAKLREYSGDAKINGLREDAEGRMIFKSKSSVFTNEGKTRFERVYDATGKLTDVNPYRDDTVGLRLSVKQLTDGSFSFFLNGLQIIKKAPRGEGAGGPFGAVEGGFEDTTSDPFESVDTPEAAPAADAGNSADIPF